MMSDLRQLPSRPWFPLAAFAVALLVLTAMLDRLPKPTGVHEIYTAQLADERLELRPDKPLEVDFTLPNAGHLRAFAIQISGIGQFGAVDVEISKDGQSVGSGRILEGQEPIIEVERPELLADGDRLTMLIAKAKLRAPTAEFVDLEHVPEALRRPFPLEEGQPVEFEFVAPDPNLDRLQLKVAHFEGGLSRVRLSVENLSSGNEITRQVFRPGSNTELRKFEGANAAGDRLRIRVERAASSTPKLRVAGNAPAGFETRAGGEVIGAAPLFRPLFDFPGLGLTLWSWAGVLVLLGLALRWEDAATPWFLIGIGLVAVATSYQSWLHLCTISEPWRDPDEYADYAEALRQWLFSPSARAEAQSFMANHPHSQTPFVPVLLALAYTLGASKFGAYAFVAGLSAFGVVLCVHHVLRRQLAFSNAVTLAGIVILVANITMLRAFARPSTDLPGLFLIIAVWPILIDRLRQERPWQLLALIGLMIANTLARPPGPAYLVYIVSATLVIDILRERRLGLLTRVRLDLLKRVRFGLLLCVPPIAVLLALTVGFGWWNNFQINAEKATLFQYAHTLTNLKVCALVMLNVLPLFWLAIRERSRPRLGALGLVAGWGVFYVVLMIVVKAPFMHRLFIPVIPVAAVLTCFGWERLARWKPWTRHAAVAFAIVFAAVNLGLLIHQMSADNYPRTTVYMPN